MGEASLYALEPAAYHALGYVFAAAVVAIVGWVFIRLYSSHKHWIECSVLALQQQQFSSSETTTNRNDVVDMETSPKAWRTALCLAAFQTSLFCLYVTPWIFTWMRFVITGLGIWSQFWLSLRYPQRLSKQTSDIRLKLTVFGGMAALTGCMLFGILTFLCWHKWEPFAAYDYYGDVLVINTTAPSYIGQDGRNNRDVLLREYYFKCPVDEAVGHVQVMWDCPTTTNHQEETTATNTCKSWMSSYHCDFTVCEGCNGKGCTQEEYTDALTTSQSCVQSNTSWYFSATNQNLQQGLLPPESTTQEADNDESESSSWSSFTMYGDCTSCTAEWEEIVDRNLSNLLPGERAILWVLSTLLVLGTMGYVVVHRTSHGEVEHSSIAIDVRDNEMARLEVR